MTYSWSKTLQFLSNGEEIFCFVFYSSSLSGLAAKFCANLNIFHWVKAVSPGAGRCMYRNPQPAQERLSRLLSACCYCSMYIRCYAIGEYTATVSEQRLGKHVPADAHVAVHLLWKRVFFCVLSAGMLWAGQFEANSSCQGTYKQGYHKFPSCPPHCAVYIYKWYAPNTWCLSRSFAEDTCIYATDRKESYVLR
jgi:hypothetical protein